MPTTQIQIAVFDPHCFQPRYEIELKKIKALANPNKELILDFVEDYRYKKKALGLARKYFLVRCFRKFSELLGAPLKPFRAEQARAIMKARQKEETVFGKPFSLQTWKEFIKNPKIWIKWANPKDYPMVLSQLKDELAVGSPYSRENKESNDFLINFIVWWFAYVA